MMRLAYSNFWSGSTSLLATSTEDWGHMVQATERHWLLRNFNVFSIYSYIHLRYFADRVGLFCLGRCQVLAQPVLLLLPATAPLHTVLLLLLQEDPRQSPGQLFRRRAYDACDLSFQGNDRPVDPAIPLK